MTVENTRILIVDDQPLIRALLQSLLAEQADLTVVGEAETLAKALELIATAAPDIVLTDLSLPETTGLEAVESIHQQFPGVAVIVVTNRPADPYETATLTAGARGFVPKHEAVAELVSAIESVQTGKVWTQSTARDAV